MLLPRAFPELSATTPGTEVQGHKARANSEAFAAISLPVRAVRAVSPTLKRQLKPSAEIIADLLLVTHHHHFLVVCSNYYFNKEIHHIQRENQSTSS